MLGYSAHSPEGRARADQWLGGRAASAVAELVISRPDLYVIAVPDQALPEVATELGAALAETAPAAWEDGEGTSAGPAVAHTSGATSVAVLAPCSEAGATTLVFHPLQTFAEPSSGASRFAGAAVAVTPADATPGSPGLAFGFSLARMLDARPFFLPDHKRGLYHAAASIACNYLVTLEHHAKHLFVDAGLPENEALSLFLPLVRATLDNVAAQGTVAALTGPLSRGDLRTIANHLEALKADAPRLLPVYRALGLATLDVVRARGEVGPETIAALEQLLGTAAPHPSSTAPPGLSGA